MSDQENTDAAVAEQGTDKDFGGGFAEEQAAEVKPNAEVKPVAEDKSESEDKIDDVAGQNGEEKKPDEEKVKPDAETEPKTAQERMEALAAKEPEKTVEEAAPVTVAPVAAPVPEKAEPAKQAGWIADLIKSPEVAETKVGVAGKEMTIAEFAEEYPEAVQAPVAIAKAMMEKALGEIEQRHTAEMSKIVGQVENMQFWEGVHGAHTDGKKVAASTEFRAWGAKQSPLVQKLMVSKNVADGIAVLDAYKESMAKEGKKAKDAVAAKHKDARDGLHGESLRGQGAAPAAAKDQEDFDAGFDSKK